MPRDVSSCRKTGPAPAIMDHSSRRRPLKLITESIDGTHRAIEADNEIGPMVLCNLLVQQHKGGATADVEGLRRFLEDAVLPWFDNRKKELANRPLIREHAFGEALDPDKLDRLGRYEVHLDRKLERMLTMLLSLKELRRG